MEPKLAEAWGRSSKSHIEIACLEPHPSIRAPSIQLTGCGGCKAVECAGCKTSQECEGSRGPAAGPQGPQMIPKAQRLHQMWDNVGCPLKVAKLFDNRIMLRSNENSIELFLFQSRKLTDQLAGATQ